MIHPSYTELIEAINTNSEDDDTTMSLNSRYSLVLATSKRARQLIAGAKPMVEGAAGKKPLAIAIDELYKGKERSLHRKRKQRKKQLQLLKLHRQRKQQPKKQQKQQKKLHRQKKQQKNNNVRTKTI